MCNGFQLIAASSFLFRISCFISSAIFGLKLSMLQSAKRLEGDVKSSRLLPPSVNDIIMSLMQELRKWTFYVSFSSSLIHFWWCLYSSICCPIILCSFIVCSSSSYDLLIFSLSWYILSMRTVLVDRSTSSMKWSLVILLQLWNTI